MAKKALFSYKTIQANSKLTDFSQTKDFVLANAVPKMDAIKKKDYTEQLHLFSF